MAHALRIKIINVMTRLAVLFLMGLFPLNLSAGEYGPKETAQDKYLDAVGILSQRTTKSDPVLFQKQHHAKQLILRDIDNGDNVDLLHRLSTAPTVLRFCNDDQFQKIFLRKLKKIFAEPSYIQEFDRMGLTKSDSLHGILNLLGNLRFHSPELITAYDVFYPRDIEAFREYVAFLQMAVTESYAPNSVHAVYYALLRELPNNMEFRPHRTLLEETRKAMGEDHRKIIDDFIEKTKPNLVRRACQWLLTKLAK